MTLPSKDENGFGHIIVCGDYEGDLKAIVNNMNALQWSTGWAGSGVTWTVKRSPVRKSSVPEGGATRERGIVGPSGDDLAPSLRPIGDIYVLNDGRRCFVDNADESFIEQWEADGVIDWDHCTLGELSALIAPHLKNGTIEFVAVHASTRRICHERLLVRSDGSAEYHKCSSWNFSKSQSKTQTDIEYFEPSHLKAHAAKWPRPK